MPSLVVLGAVTAEAPPLSGLTRRFWSALSTMRMRSTVGLKSKPYCSGWPPWAVKAGVIGVPTEVAAPVAGLILYS